MENDSEGICPFCRLNLVVGDDFIKCSQCGTIYHRHCWKKNGGCSKTSCRGSINAIKTVEPAVQRICPKCDTLNEPDFLFCIQCGEKLTVTTEPTPATSTSISPKPAGIVKNPAPKKDDSSAPLINGYQMFGIFVLALVILILSIIAIKNITSNMPKTKSPTPGSFTAFWDTLYKDNFSNDKSGWYRFSGSEGMTEYSNGAFKISITNPYSYMWSTAGKSFTDGKIDVDVTNTTGLDENNMGVICRYVDQNNYYLAKITNGGTYWVEKYVDGSVEILITNDGNVSDKINTGSTPNHIQFICNGTTLSLLVNNTLMGSCTDTTFSVGDVGLYAGASTQGGTEVLFDNFVVTKP
jgi:hypothetical protein